VAQLMTDAERCAVITGLALGTPSTMPPAPVARADALLGAAIEATVKRHHRRRLRRLGHGGVLDPPPTPTLFATGDPAPRPGCTLEVLVDGATALPAMAQALRVARSHVHITGWHLASHFELIRGEHPIAIGPLLAELAERIDVRVMVWAGSPVPLFHPTRKEVEAEVEKLTRGTRIQAFRDPREHPVHCHHEKTLVIDDEVAFVNGIDMTDQAGDRFDGSEHPARRKLGWHDVGTRLTGPAVADVANHFNMRWREVSGETLPPPVVAPPLAGAHTSTVQIVRTVSEDMYDAVPKGDFRILESYIRAIRAAQDYIYFENQFLWSPEIVDELVAKLKDPPTADFRLLVLLPARANNGQDGDDTGNSHFLATTIRSRTGTRDDPLYVHAKVGIVDDRWLTIGSANLNAHSLLNDTELNVVTDDAVLARATRERLWAEHLEVDQEAIAGIAPARVVDERWRAIAMEQLRRRQAGVPPTHRLIALPGVSKRARRLLGPLQGMVDDG
jgi:phosphatidylserine/phosphatidylglycerophosphate/cardiolipin synthase-like enzyme